MIRKKLIPHWELEANRAPEGAMIAHVRRLETAEGHILKNVEIPYCTYGTLNASGTNAVVILHALSSSCLVASKGSIAGWWEDIVGDGKPIDTQKYFVVCISNLCSPFGAPSPINSAEGTYKKSGQVPFPRIIFRDIITSHRQILKQLNIKKVHALIGPSMGGMTALEWALRFPADARKVILICSTWRAYCTNIANRAIQREAILANVKDPCQGVVIARMQSLLSYTTESRLGRYLEPLDPLQVGNPTAGIAETLQRKARYFAQRYPASCYLAFLEMMDAFDTRSLIMKYDGNHKPEMLVLSATSDMLFDVAQQFDMVHELKTVDWPVHHDMVTTEMGHDSFLIEHEKFGPRIKDFLA